jgi:hypothetical protein
MSMLTKFECWAKLACWLAGWLVKFDLSLAQLSPSLSILNFKERNTETLRDHSLSPFRFDSPTIVSKRLNNNMSIAWFRDEFLQLEVFVIR